MSHDPNYSPDEYTSRSKDGCDDDAVVPIPIFSRADLEPEELAELDMWQTLWEQGKASDEAFAGVIQRVYTRVNARFGIEAATLDEAMITVRLLRGYLWQKRTT